MMSKLLWAAGTVAATVAVIIAARKFDPLGLATKAGL